MVIVEVTGGLGNQMFQFALYRRLKEMGKEAALDLSFYKSKQSLRKFELDIFKLNYKEAPKREIQKLRGSTGNACRIERAITERIYRNKKVYTEDLDQGYQPVIFEMDPCYLSGYWQNEYYFRSIRDELLQEFQFPECAQSDNREILAKIRGANAVSVHVRRGDYLHGANSRLYEGICTAAYYRKAVSYIKENVDNPVFYFFTDDPDWVEANLCEEDMVVVRHEKDKPDYYDMYLMSQCKAHVLANSTFSWWGAWLDPNEDKIVVSPSRWLNGHDIPNAVCDWFIKIES